MGDKYQLSHIDNRLVCIAAEYYLSATLGIATLDHLENFLPAVSEDNTLIICLLLNVIQAMDHITERIVTDIFCLLTRYHVTSGIYNKWTGYSIIIDWITVSKKRKQNFVSG